MADTKASAFPVVTTVNPNDLFPLIATPGVTNAVATWSNVIAPHTAASDPHPQYLTPAEGNAAYDALGVAAVVAGDLAAHIPDTTLVHGFANTTVIPSLGRVAALPWIALR